MSRVAQLLNVFAGFHGHRAGGFKGLLEGLGVWTSPGMVSTCWFCICVHVLVHVYVYVSCA